MAFRLAFYTDCHIIFYSDSYNHYFYDFEDYCPPHYWLQEGHVP